MAVYNEDEANRKIFRIKEQLKTEKMDNIVKLSNSVESIANNITTSCWGMQTGIDKLDEVTLGLHPKELTIIAGRSSIGKTSLAIGMAMNLGKEHTVYFCSLEMSAKLMIERMIANYLEVSLHNLKLGLVEQKRIDNAIEYLQTLDIYIDDTSSMSPGQLAQKLKEIDVDCVIVDYLQLMSLGGGNEARWLEIDIMCKGLRNIAKEYDIPILLLCQLNREVEKRNNHEPRLSDLRESGGVEQTADCVVLIHRPVYYEMREIDIETEDDGEAWLFVAKNRNGKTGRIPCVFLPEAMAFRNPNFKVEF